VGERLAALLQGFAPINTAARRLGIPTIGVSHGTVNGCTTEHGVPMAGLDHEFTTGSLFSAGASAFLLGHIHKHQVWKDAGRRIAYAGSIGRFHYGEQGAKGFLLWRIDAATAEFDLIETPTKRTIEIAFEGLPDMTELTALVERQNVAEAFVRVRWNVPDEDRHQVDRDAIQRLFKDAAEVKLEGRVIPVVRTRAAGISRETSIAAKVQAWVRATDAHAEPLLDCLQALQCQTPDEIAASVLSPDQTESANLPDADEGAKTEPEAPSQSSLESLELF
jgi:exonuclease SbcD